jgi:hypothetical protein
VDKFPQRTLAGLANAWRAENCERWCFLVLLFVLVLVLVLVLESMREFEDENGDDTEFKSRRLRPDTNSTGGPAASRPAAASSAASAASW